MALQIPIGIDDFRKLREAGLEYVDKTSLICELITRSGVEVVLLPRPRRFGKTLNLSMVRCFFEKTDTDLSHLFKGLSIWQAGDAYRAHFQRYPVIHFNFKGSKGQTFEHCFATIREKIIDLYQEHRVVLDSGSLSDVDARRYREVLDGAAERWLLERALLDLSSYLHAHHGEKVLILIDEYDEPIHASHLHGYASEMLGLMRGFLGAGLKSNPHLFRAVLTGILRVAKESLFSGLNNLGVYTLLATPFNTCFGFTEQEVEALLQRTGCADRLAVVRGWYNGYVFGGQVIYNPWSVLSYLDRLDDAPQPYWLSTSSNDLVHELLEHYALSVEPAFETLLEGGAIERTLDENVVLSELKNNERALWSLLVFSGYLKAERLRGDLGDQPVYRLSIPNREVRIVYTTTFENWMRRSLSRGGGAVETLSKALLRGDALDVEEQINLFARHVLSFHDTGKVQPERLYHGFLVGLLASMEPEYQVRSNRESGLGRPDVVIRPLRPGKPGAVLELKVARAGRVTLEQALDQGAEQLAKLDYTAELRAAGASPVFAYVVAFDGKEARVRAVDAGGEPDRAM